MNVVEVFHRGRAWKRKVLLVRILSEGNRGFMSFKRYIEAFVVYGIRFWRKAERPIRVESERFGLWRAAEARRTVRDRSLCCGRISCRSREDGEGERAISAEERWSHLKWLRAITERGGREGGGRQEGTAAAGEEEARDWEERGFKNRVREKPVNLRVSEQTGEREREMEWEMRRELYDWMVPGQQMALLVYRESWLSCSLPAHLHHCCVCSTMNSVWIVKQGGAHSPCDVDNTPEKVPRHILTNTTDLWAVTIKIPKAAQTLTCRGFIISEWGYRI